MQLHSPVLKKRVETPRVKWLYQNCGKAHWILKQIKLEISPPGYNSLKLKTNEAGINLRG